MTVQNELRIVLTLLGFLCFLGICFWAYSRRSKDRFDDIAQQVVEDDDKPSSGQRS